MLEYAGSRVAAVPVPHAERRRLPMRSVGLRIGADPQSSLLMPSAVWSGRDVAHSLDSMLATSSAGSDYAEGAQIDVCALTGRSKKALFTPCLEEFDAMRVSNLLQEYSDRTTARLSVCLPSTVKSFGSFTQIALEVPTPRDATIQPDWLAAEISMAWPPSDPMATDRRPVNVTEIKAIGATGVLLRVQCQHTATSLRISIPASDLKRRVSSVMLHVINAERSLSTTGISPTRTSHSGVRIVCLRA